MKAKKVISAISILIIAIIIFSVNINAATWKYVWDNTSITIPVGESFDKYKDIPKATLYKNGTPLNDANITYNTEGDWLFYSKNVNTTKTGVLGRKKMITLGQSSMIVLDSRIEGNFFIYSRASHAYTHILYRSYQTL